MSGDQLLPYRDKDGRPRYPIAPGLSAAVLALVPGRPGVVETVGYVAAILRFQLASRIEPAGERDRLRALRLQAQDILAALESSPTGIEVARGVAEHKAGAGALDDAARLLVDSLKVAEDWLAEQVRPGRAARSFPRSAATCLAPTVDSLGGDADLLAALAAIALEAAGAGEHQGTEGHLRREAVHALRRERARTRGSAP
jgi:hypothetical protein